MYLDLGVLCIDLEERRWGIAVLYVGERCLIYRFGNAKVSDNKKQKKIMAQGHHDKTKVKIVKDLYKHK